MNRWSEEEKQFVRDNVDKMTPEQISEHLNRSVDAVLLFIHRNRIVFGETVKRNIVIELLRLRFAHPEDFTPSSHFYRETGITPQRWWKLYKGNLQVSEQDYLAITKYLNISLEEAFNCRQLSFFDAGGGGVTKG